jgi:hypothetical protein
MAELLREKFVNRKDRTRTQFRDLSNDLIRVFFYDYDRKKVTDVTRKEANNIAKENPSQLFYFQDKNSTVKELNITQVNNLVVENDLIKTNPCLIGPQPCSSPFLSVLGGGGFGALINPIISPISSSLIAFDIVDGGKNYTSPPFVQVIDNCGRGSGGKFQTVISNGSITKIIVKSPGNGYLSSPDGSYGGGGKIIKTSDQGLIQKPDGAFEVTSPNTVPELQPGETFIPPKASVPSSGLGVSYPIVLEIEDVDIINTGFGYSSEDKLIVTPDNGAVLEPIIDNGRIVKVTVIESGIGFDDFPEITTNSTTGFNFSARPIFRVRRIEEEKELIIPRDVSVISVIDCIGKR